MQEFQQHLFIHKYQPRYLRIHPFVGKRCDNISLKMQGYKEGNNAIKMKWMVTPFLLNICMTTILNLQWYHPSNKQFGPESRPSQKERIVSQYSQLPVSGAMLGFRARELLVGVVAVLFRLIAVPDSAKKIPASKRLKSIYLLYNRYTHIIHARIYFYHDISYTYHYPYIALLHIPNFYVILDMKSEHKRSKTTARSHKKPGRKAPRKSVRFLWPKYLTQVTRKSVQKKWPKNLRFLESSTA